MAAKPSSQLREAAVRGWPCPICAQVCVQEMQQRWLGPGCGWGPLTHLAAGQGTGLPHKPGSSAPAR